MLNSMTRKPDVQWLEGLLTHFETKFPHGTNDPRRMGFFVGQQIVGLYLLEMLFKYALDNAGVQHGHHHNLHELFQKLPRQRRRAIERRCTALLNAQCDWAWDVAKTADSLLLYLGRSAITDTRYFWEPDRSHAADHASILFAPDMLRPLIYALLITLFNYPTKPIIKRYNTTFRSLAESLEEDRHSGAGAAPAAPTSAADTV